MKNIAGGIAVAFLLAPMATFAADGVGEVRAVIVATIAAGLAGDRELAVGSDVFLGDQVSTDAAGQAQLLFADGTLMVVGPNSSLVIDEFLFRGKSADNKFAVRALGGAFRFISGQSGERAYSIRTPTGTISVRGTAFDFTVGPDDTGLVLLKGAAIVCASENNCETVTTTCQLVRADKGNHVEIVHNPKVRLKQTQQQFPYQVSQGGLLGEFRINGTECGSAGVGSGAGSGGKGGGESDSGDSGQGRG